MDTKPRALFSERRVIDCNIIYLRRSTRWTFLRSWIMTISTFLQLVYEHLKRRKRSTEYARNVNIQTPASVYALGYYPPKLKDFHRGTSVYVEKNRISVSRRVVSKDAFYGSRNRRNVIMIEEKDTNERFPADWFSGVVRSTAPIFQVACETQGRAFWGMGSLLRASNNTKRILFCEVWSSTARGRHQHLFNRSKLELHGATMAPHTWGWNAFSAYKYDLVPLISIRALSTLFEWTLQIR